MKTNIPEWTAQGIIPPKISDQPNLAYSSPYPISLVDLIGRFANTPERRKLISGFLSYRKILHNFGFINGFQWIDGSFIENIEMLDKRSPNDIDVVTFLEDDISISDDDLSELEYHHIKSKYFVDTQYLELAKITPREITEYSAFWYGVWSHKRNHIWKGYLKVELAPDEDNQAADLLLKLSQERGQS